MRGEPRSAGGIHNQRAHKPNTDHYLTDRACRELARDLRTNEEAQGIHRRWNDRRLTSEEAAQRTRTAKAELKRRKRRKRLKSTNQQIGKS